MIKTSVYSGIRNQISKTSIPNQNINFILVVVTGVMVLLNVNAPMREPLVVDSRRG